MRRASLLYLFGLLTLALFSPIAANAQSASGDEQLVANAWPAQFNPTAVRLYDYARADLDGTGTAAYLVAVYCDGVHGLVRVLRAANGQVVVESNFPAMVGDTPHLRLIDLDGDGKPEIIASFGTMGGTITWPLKWSPSALTLFGPYDVTTRGVVRSLLSLTEFVDVDGDGKPEIINTTGGDQPHTVLLQLGPDGRYTAQSSAVLYVNRFVRHDGDPELFTGVFSATAGARLSIRVTNGDAKGLNRVTAGDFFLNGKPLITPGDFKKAARSFTFTATANDRNEVEVSLTGKPGTQITVAVTAEP